MRVRMTKLSSTHDPLRGGSADGVPAQWCWPPAEGYAFMLVGDALDGDQQKRRYVTTTTVRAVRTLADGQSYEFDTYNSTYRVEMLEEKDGTR